MPAAGEDQPDGGGVRVQGGGAGGGAGVAAGPTRRNRRGVEFPGHHVFGSSHSGAGRGVVSCRPAGLPVVRGISSNARPSSVPGNRNARACASNSANHCFQEMCSRPDPGRRPAKSTSSVVVDDPGRAGAGWSLRAPRDGAGSSSGFVRDRWWARPVDCCVPSWAPARFRLSLAVGAPKRRCPVFAPSGWTPGVSSILRRGTGHCPLVRIGTGRAD